jgi:predicted anti-sigma-YlaC factor YlaD
MSCEQIRERMPDVAAGFSELTPDEGKHLASCEACAEQMKAMRSTMALLDEWQAPEPSPYFDVRLQARLREEIAKVPTGWFYWLRRPALAAALTVLMGVGVGLVFTHGSGIYAPAPQVMADAEPGTAVGDLQTLENNHELYSDFELLDDLDLQQDVVANP